MVFLTNFPPATSTIDPGNTISVGQSDTPPIQPGRYFVTLYNPSTYLPQSFFIIAAFEVGQIVPVDFNSAGPVPLLDDAVTYAFITNTSPTTPTRDDRRDQRRHPRGSSAHLGSGVSFDQPGRHAFSADGKSRAEHREPTAAASLFIRRRHCEPPAGGNGNTSADIVLRRPNPPARCRISWKFYTIPDNDDLSTTRTAILTRPQTCFLAPAWSAVRVRSMLAFTTTDGGLTIIVNQFGTPANGDAWTSTAGSVSTNYYYLAFTEDTNLTTTPIKVRADAVVPTNHPPNLYSCTGAGHERAQRPERRRHMDAGDPG